MSIDQMDFYQRKLAYEMDSADLYEALQKDEAIVVIDGRSSGAYAEEHIPGAISLPHREISFNSTEMLGQVEALRLLLRRHRVQRLHEDGAEAPDAGVPGTGADRGDGLVEARRLRHPRERRPG